MKLCSYYFILTQKKRILFIVACAAAFFFLLQHISVPDEAITVYFCAYFVLSDSITPYLCVLWNTSPAQQMYHSLAWLSNYTHCWGSASMCNYIIMQDCMGYFPVNDCCFPSIIYINICMFNIFLRSSVSFAWGPSCGRGVSCGRRRGGLVITPRLCYRVELCWTASLSQKYIWQERTREGEGKMETLGRDREDGWGGRLRIDSEMELRV